MHEHARALYAPDPPKWSNYATVYSNEVMLICGQQQQIHTVTNHMHAINDYETHTQNIIQYEIICKG